MKILMSDPLVSTIKVQTSAVPFVDLFHFDTDIVVDTTISNRGGYYSFVRFPVAHRLSLAKKYLPKGWRFFIKEGYRPLHIQERAFERSIHRMKNIFQGQDESFIFAEASKYVAPPKVAPHPTGGAVDLTLLDANGNEVDMGTDYDAFPIETKNATFFEAVNITEEARQNRQILAFALKSVGFVNYYTEWWHWSYGDRYWAALTGNDKALYHPVSEQELLSLSKNDIRLPSSRVTV